LEIYEEINHNETGIDHYTPRTPEHVIFAANTSCILTPEVTDGPYYVSGERIRKNVKEDKYSDGVDLYLEVQYLDINTCKPVAEVYVDIWNCNATGVYRYDWNI
jgi:protocatechuate 3,4-dioxygenase beta subunit